MAELIKLRLSHLRVLLVVDWRVGIVWLVVLHYLLLLNQFAIKTCLLLLQGLDDFKGFLHLFERMMILQLIFGSRLLKFVEPCELGLEFLLVVLKQH